MREHVERKCVAAERQGHAWKMLERRFGALRPAEVTRDTIKAHVAARYPTKPSSIFVELRLLTASWAFAIKRRVIAPQDVPILDDLDLPNPPPPRERWLREWEVQRLFAAAAEIRAERDEVRQLRVERFMWIALATAARRTAILELTWEQVDFETRVIHLNPAGRPQTTKRRASVPIPDLLLPVLQRAYAERIGEFVLDHSSRLHDALNTVAKRASVKGVTAHVFRHTHATWLARRGVSLWKIAKILGNSVEEVERTYAKHCPNDLRDAVNLIGADLIDQTFDRPCSESPEN